MLTKKGTQYNDDLLATWEAEEFIGLGGFDLVSYATADSSVAILITRGQYNTGDAAGDTFASIEGFRLSTHNDYFEGSANNENVNGGLGHDTIIGLGGVDALAGHNGYDTLLGGDGNDGLWGGGENDFLMGGNGDDSMSGDSGDDYLFGDDFAGQETGNDFLWGDTGNDVIYGGNGADILCGAFGSDQLTGGMGNDYFNLSYDVNNGDVDYINDLKAGDYVLMDKAYENNTYFFQSGSYAFGYVPELDGKSYYLFVAAGMTAAQLDAATLFV
jgi:serralysin